MYMSCGTRQWLERAVYENWMLKGCGWRWRSIFPISTSTLMAIEENDCAEISNILRALILCRCRRFINHLLTYLLTFHVQTIKPICMKHSEGLLVKDWGTGTYSNNYYCHGSERCRIDVGLCVQLPLHYTVDGKSGVTQCSHFIHSTADIESSWLLVLKLVKNPLI